MQLWFYILVCIHSSMLSVCNGSVQFLKGISQIRQIPNPESQQPFMKKISPGTLLHSTHNDLNAHFIPNVTPSSSWHKGASVISIDVTNRKTKLILS